MKTVGVYIGRFQPFHRGHLATLTAALEKFDHVILVFGSATSAPTLKNPWTASERFKMVSLSLPSLPQNKLLTIFQGDNKASDIEWANTLKATVSDAVAMLKATIEDEYKVYLTGCKKDDSSFYLDMFPDWPFISGTLTDHGGTEVREALFRGDPIETWEQHVTAPVASFLQSFKKTEVYKSLKEQFDVSTKESHPEGGLV